MVPQQVMMGSLDILTFLQEGIRKAVVVRNILSRVLKFYLSEPETGNFDKLHSEACSKSDKTDSNEAILLRVIS